MATNLHPKTFILNEDEIEANNTNNKREETVNETDKVHKWELLNLKPELMKGIYSVGFENPSFIQKKAIPCIAEGRDVRAQAQSGTGKTGAFVIGALQRIDESLRAPQCLVLASTREIARQNGNKFEEIGSYMKVHVSFLLGGGNISNDIASLNKGPHIVVGTPGRINHMIDSGYLKTKDIKLFILDEADEMLKIGFEEQVRNIYCKIENTSVQSLLFSATYSEEDLIATKKVLKNPVEIDLRHEEQTLKGIKQLYVDIGGSKMSNLSPAAKDQEVILKTLTLMDIFKNQTLAQVLVFINKKSHAALVHKTLNENGYPCELISSDLDQAQRDKTIEDFKSGKTRILVSSGLCKRGIDVQSLSVVVCLDVPNMEEKNDFIHRVGRSGRYGRKGIAIHILSRQELDSLNEIAKHFESIVVPMTTGFSFKD